MGRHSARPNGSRANRTQRPQRRKDRIEISSGPDIIDPVDSLKDVGGINVPRRRRGSGLEPAPRRLHSEIMRRRQRNKKFALAFVVGLVVLIAVGAIGTYAYIKHSESRLQKSFSDKKPLELTLKKVEPLEPYNLLIMGFDNHPGETVWRSDVMLLTRVDPQEGKVWMVSLPRDYKAAVEGHGFKKLNAAYQLGGEQLAIDTIEKLTGQKINHYMGVGLDGFQVIVDAMGGVDIDVPEKFDDPKADRSGDGSARYIDKGFQTLDGLHAMTFVRSRNFPDGDFARMRHQQLFFKALADQSATKLTTAQLLSAANKIIPYLSTDMSAGDLLRTVKDLKDAGSANVYTATLPGTWVSPFVVPDEAGKAEILRKFAAGEPFELTPEQIAEQELENLSPEDVTVTIRNGTTTVGLAKQAASVLRTRGFDVKEVGNTEIQSVYDKTLVVYKLAKPKAELVAKYLQPGVKLVESKGMYKYDTEVLVVIGKDWDVEKLPVAEISTR